MHYLGNGFLEYDNMWPWFFNGLSYYEEGLPSLSKTLLLVSIESTDRDSIGKISSLGSHDGKNIFPFSVASSF